ncbi:30S ribosomal protein S21 [candidate division WWE3 bacterium RBG_19FT_COMBO_34_6]|uniref:Small ribosomal subunit protein bS21 n=1 Tax=candidate division WWE3 bacterium RBG_19FT_COMBO_34_6 TaxID=1802612 RepID=A0A1F4UN76_UNCKA|nr:MAG: 30S ribosomal protein S21 [candidate division WWE3 bacterium RBG_19FT_COMBO_34_6]
MTKIKVRKGESLEQALRRFNREVHRARILQEVKDRERYRKPSEIRRQKRKELARRIFLERRRR